MYGFVHISTVPLEARRWHGIPWSWSYKFWELNSSPLQELKSHPLEGSDQLGMVAHAYNPALRGLKQEDCCQ